MMEAQREGEIKGLKILDQETISHLLFVDDVLCFAQGFVRDITTLKRVLDLYCKPTKIVVKLEKYCLYHYGILDLSLWVIKNSFTL
jgi:hypothetical protein